MKHLVVLGPSGNLQDTVYDGFVNRHVDLIQQLALSFRVTLIKLNDYNSEHEWHPRLLALDSPRAVMQLPEFISSRRARAEVIKHNVRVRQGPQAGEEVWRMVRSHGPDCVLTLGPWHDMVYERVYRGIGTVHLAEEDIYRMPGLSPQSRRGQTYRNVELLSRRRLRGQPRSVVVIADSEQAPARRRYPRSTVHVLPYTLPIDDWPLASGPAEGDHVLVPGVLVQDRNADGLVDFLRALKDQTAAIPVRLLSDAGLHSRIHPFLEFPWVEHVPSESDLALQYRRAKLAVIPALKATGMKTTILQSWSAGLPVCTYDGSARTIPKRHRGAIVSSSNGFDLAQAVLQLWGDSDARGRLARAGLKTLKDSYDGRRNAAVITGLLHEAAGRY